MDEGRDEVERTRGVTTEETLSTCQLRAPQDALNADRQIRAVESAGGLGGQLNERPPGAPGPQGASPRK